MDTRQTVPNCLDVKETIRDAPENIHSNLSMQRRVGLSNVQALDFLEAALSPAKYALFHYFGHIFLAVCGLPIPFPPTSTIKVGALGGTMLAIFYFGMLLRRSRRPSNSWTDDDSIAFYVTNLCKEIFYSGVAAYLGGLGCGQKSDTMFLVIMGVAGPVISVVAVVVLLILAVSVAWCVERFRDWLAGY